MGTRDATARTLVAARVRGMSMGMAEAAAVEHKTVQLLEALERGMSLDITVPRELGVQMAPAPRTDGIDDVDIHLWLPARVYETLVKLADVQDRTLEQQARHMLRGMLDRRAHEGDAD